jgi:hypothetical protein
MGIVAAFFFLIYIYIYIHRDHFLFVQVLRLFLVFSSMHVDRCEVSLLSFPSSRFELPSYALLTAQMMQHGSLFFFSLLLSNPFGKRKEINADSYECITTMP